MTHWRLCEHTNKKMLYQDWILDIWECECGVRMAHIRRDWPAIFDYPLFRYANWRLRKVFNEEHVIRWWPTEEF